LETKDALGRFSATLIGYNQTLSTAVATNTAYKQLGFDGFEDYGNANCTDKHFKMASSTVNLSETESHTGRKSIAVTPATPTTLSAQIVDDCADVVDCNLQIGISAGTRENGYVYQITAINGIAPYQISYELLNGGYSAELTPSGDGLIFSRTGTSALIDAQVSITDANGCVVTKRFGN
jgi:hypothetical protein